MSSDSQMKSASPVLKAFHNCFNLFGTLNTISAVTKWLYNFHAQKKPETSHSFIFASHSKSGPRREGAIKVLELGQAFGMHGRVS